MADLDGRVVVVGGASSGLGEQFAPALDRAGAPARRCADGLLVLLLSDASAYLSGQTLPGDGRHTVT